ncbi:MAG: hypothetical protein GC164_14485 [Phycisphaera sp.]|nr:hypothetical protein [Phycisphaera sp.]
MPHSTSDRAAQSHTSPPWPMLKSYDGDHLTRIAMPIGGIGTGTVSLGGRGDLRDWEVMNRPAKGFTPAMTRNRPSGVECIGPFFALWCRDAKGATHSRCLEGPLPWEDYEGPTGSRALNHGLPRFASARFDAAYPLASIQLSDDELPLQVRLEAFNPLVPGDEEASGLPVAVMRYVLHNPGSQTVKASVCGCVPNFIGTGPNDLGKEFEIEHKHGEGTGNINQTRDGENITGLFMQNTSLDPHHPYRGTMALSTFNSQTVSKRTQWNTRPWAGGSLEFWTQFSQDGVIADQDGPGQNQHPMAGLAVSLELPPGQSRSVTFFISWHFPNRLTWWRRKDGQYPVIGNHYTARFPDAWAAAEHTSKNLPSLEKRTVAFVRSVVESDVPDVVREAALFNVSTLRTQTCFRTPDGYFYSWEGCGDTTGCCHGSCTHVWNYESTLALLFGNLSRGTREIEFHHATDELGLMAFRVDLPLAAGRQFSAAAADGQMGCLVRLYLDWQLSGDDAFLNKLWPSAKKALEFCWLPGGWDADKDGVMEGCQHNTMDVEYFGPNPQMTGWYLAALRACEEMARHLGDTAFADTCHDLFTRGSRWMDEHLFNGEYYEHHVRPPSEGVSILKGLNVGMGAKNNADPDFQLANGCLVDQLVGQMYADLAGLGAIHDRDKVRATLASILRHNRRSNFRGHFNNMRSYVLGDETALLMASYPRGHRPRFPMPYYNEVMTGFEYVVAIGLIQQGKLEEGLRVVSDISSRYDGRKRSPFDEAECGHHYIRAMAAWGCLLAWTGFHYSAVAGVMRFRLADVDSNTKWFWSTGQTFGSVTQQRYAEHVDVVLEIIEGSLNIQRMDLTGNEAVFSGTPGATDRNLGPGSHRLRIVTKP